MPVAWQLVWEKNPGYAVGWSWVDGEGNAFLASATLSSMWRLEGERWRRVFPDPGLPQFEADLGALVVVYDPDRRRLVVLRHTRVNYEDALDHWEFSWETGWIRRDDVEAPTFRRDTIAAGYDPRRKRVVIFGGIVDPPGQDDRATNETWEFDGVRWERRELDIVPYKRTRMSMEWDDERGYLVLFSGQNDTEDELVVYRDTWLYDGAWHRAAQMPLERIPSPRTTYSMAWDPKRRQVVLFGGWAGGGLDDMWAWTGDGWEEIVTATRPPARWGAALEWSDQRQALVLYGGSGDGGLLDDTWEFDGSDWKLIEDPPGPHARSVFGMAYDRAEDVLVVTGGGELHPDRALADLRAIWLWDGERWRKSSERVRGMDYPLSATMRLTYDEANDRIVGYGLSARIHLAEGERAKLYVFRQRPAEWLSLEHQDPGDYVSAYHAWSYDSRRGEVVMFGGRARVSVYGFGRTNATWILRGDDWTRFEGDPVPPVRQETAMAYDPVRGVHWLYGGNGQNVYLSDLWRFDGERWEDVLAESPPGKRRSHDLAFDEVRARLILYGNFNMPGPSYEGITWEWDGGRWIAQPTPLQPETNRAAARLEWDPDHEVTWLFGGTPEQERQRSDLWAYGPDPDGDGIVGKLDNCAVTINPEQSDVDGDGAGDACDCAPGDPGAFAVPAEVTGVRFAADAVTLSWDSAAPGAGPDTVHDLFRGPARDLPATDAAECLARGLAGTSFEDAARPAAGESFWYLVRGRNACGAGTLGGGREETRACD